MNEQQKKRRFWQIHLSTAIVLMFVSGMFISRNIQTYGQSRDHKYPLFRGWPFVAFTDDVSYRWPDSLSDLAERTYSSKWNVWGVAADVGVAIAMLTLTGLILEYLIRRREARKP